MFAGCGPGGPPSLEGFGEVGETEDDPGHGDGDDPGDGDGEDPGDGDGDEPSECHEADFGNESFIYHEGYIDQSTTNDHDGFCFDTWGPDYSIAWQAPVSGSYRATLQADWLGWLEVLRGGCNGELENCAGAAFPTILDFYAVEGEDYTFVFDSDWDAEGFFWFTLEPVAVSNECPVAELFNQQESISGTTVGAENAFWSGCGGDQAPDQGFVFYPPVTGTYRIDTFGSNYDTMLHVFDGYCGGGALACDDDTDFDTTSEIFIELSNANVYTIVVDGWGSSAGDYQLNLELVDGPSVCDNIELLESVVPTGASWSSDEDIGNIFNQCSFAAFERRHLWYAPADGLYQVSLDGGPLFSSVAALLGGCGGDGVMCQVGPEPLLFDAVEGQEVVFVSEWDGGGVGDLTLLVEAVGGMPGCGTQLPSDLPVVVQGTTSGAGNQYDGSCMVNPANEVEYWWTPPETGTYLFSTDGSAYDTMMYIRNGGCDGTELGCSDDTFDGQNVYLYSTLELELMAGQTVSIFVDGYSSSGSYQLSITQI